MKLKMLLVLISSSCSMLFATIINVPTDQPTIQAGINSAVNGDTVLVATGTYVENINYNGKNIVIGSLFLTTLDTTYISQTIIDGNQNGSVVTFESGEDSTAVLVGFNITNGYASESGGGILCIYDSNPSLVNVAISGNSALYVGGGILCENSSPSLVNVTITGNSVTWGGGGGIYCTNSNPSLVNVTITDNNADYGGGGIYCRINSSPSLINVTITGNSATWGEGGGIYCTSSNLSLVNVTIAGNSAYHGGGIYLEDSNSTLQDVMISENSCSDGGGGIYSENSDLILFGVTIMKNDAYYAGGGVYFEDSNPLFDPDNRCNIYLNHAMNGNDMYSDALLNVIVDTFTVLNPTGFHTSPIENFTFDILQGTVIQTEADLYVSPEGDNNNSGLTADDPLKTIYFACAKTLADSLNPQTIHLLDGIYSPATNGEYFPVSIPDYVNLSGDTENGVTLDAEGLDSVIGIYDHQKIIISNLTITGGSRNYGGGGIYCYNSSPSLVNVTIIGNSAYHGSGIYCCNNSSPSLVNVTITGNSANTNGGGIYCYDSNPSLVNVTITGNSVSNKGGGIYCYDSNPSLVNVTITGNSAWHGGGIYCNDNSNPSLVNCILWNDLPNEVIGSPEISYSDIQGGWTGEGNIDENPLFVGAGEHPFSLLEDSPCIDEGIPDTTGLNLPELDLAGNPRIYNGIIDMGAYEWQGVGIDDWQSSKTVNILSQNYPNPFNPETTIEYSLKEPGNICLEIYNIRGQKVRTLVNEFKAVGYYNVIWEGTDDNDKNVASGIYFYQMKTKDYSTVKKMILLR